MTDADRRWDEWGRGAARRRRLRRSGFVSEPCPSRYCRSVPARATPEEAVRADESVAPEYARVVAVEHAPDGTSAVVFIAYNEPPDVEPYVVLCENTPDGWSTRSALSGGEGWMSTTDDGSLGVQTTWDPPRAHWSTPAPDYPDVGLGSNTW